mmetsp:Transcript_1076/g.3589  ORF Transcript_1076/g.3589 Transcript_1076/m.3589 type:complete len:258 (-) Transcript_1076:613-1386(-)
MVCASVRSCRMRHSGPAGERMRPDHRGGGPLRHRTCTYQGGIRCQSLSPQRKRRCRCRILRLRVPSPKFWPDDPLVLCGSRLAGLTWSMLVHLVPSAEAHLQCCGMRQRASTSLASSLRWSSPWVTSPSVPSRFGCRRSASRGPTLHSAQQAVCGCSHYSTLWRGRFMALHSLAAGGRPPSSLSQTPVPASALPSRPTAMCFRASRRTWRASSACTPAQLTRSSWRTRAGWPAGSSAGEAPPQRSLAALASLRPWNS